MNLYPRIEIQELLDDDEMKYDLIHVDRLDLDSSKFHTCYLKQFPEETMIKLSSSCEK